MEKRALVEDESNGFVILTGVSIIFVTCISEDNITETPLYNAVQLNSKKSSCQNDFKVVYLSPL